MINSANSYPVSALLSTDEKLSYLIPPYQREYKWEKNQWEAIFDDIYENNEGYFIGSLICINVTTDVLAPRLEVVDGQQRLATISILYAGLYKVLFEHKEMLNEDQRTDLQNLKRRLVKDNIIKLNPQKQNNNNKDYFALLKEIGVISGEDVSKISYAEKRKVFRAYKYFVERSNQIINKNGHIDPSNIDELFCFIEKVNQALMVKIEVKDHADAFTLFESLNNRGVPLTPIDLIKNKILSKTKTTEIENCISKWNGIIENLSDDYAVQERFFRQLYNAFKHDFNEPFRKNEDNKQEPLGSLATKSNLIHIYDKIIENDAESFTKRIEKDSEYYSYLLLKKSDDIGELNQIGKSMQSLSRIQGAPSYLLLLYLLHIRIEKSIPIEQIIGVINILRKFFVRRNLTDTPPTRDLNRIFMSLVDKIRNKYSISESSEYLDENIVRESTKENDLCTIVSSELLSISASKAIFEEKLCGHIYEENSGVARYILCEIEEASMTRETEIDLWKVDGKQFVWTIEHIFPQGENIPESWVLMIANGDIEKAKSIQRDYVHKLGNLTLTGFNSTLSNKSFREKRDRADSDGKYVGYKNKLTLNEDLKEVDSWTIERIKDRTTKLAKKAVELFGLPNE